MAEKFRDEGKDVLLFVDNIYRYTLAGTEVSALLGRMPSAVGYQPTLAEEMGVLQERITTTKTGSITSVQAVYVPADDLTDPSPATTFAHLDSTVHCLAILRRSVFIPRLIPLTQPLASLIRWLLVRSITMLRRVSKGTSEVQGIERHHRNSRHGRAVGRRQAHRLSSKKDQSILLAADACR